ncbi:MAG TPA: sialidase family protein [Actinomycetota bacterium]|jgi:hypothetical protein|nr:sialidase family protein [Actinomycetota bacterium]
MRKSILPLPLLLILVAGSFRPAEAASGPRVIRDVHAGRHVLQAEGQQQQDTVTEPSISVNPRNPLNAVAMFQTGRVDAGCSQANGYATTFDGGKTWKTGAFPELTVANGGSVPLSSDPVVAFGPNNVVYANHLMCDGDFNDLATSVSTDGGKTWGPPIPVPTERTLPLDDKNWITVDNGTGPGHHTGRVYLVWDNVAPVVAMYSDDQAKTWQGPFVVYPGQGIGSLPLVMPNGDLAVVVQGTQVLPTLPSEGSPDPSELTATEKYLVAVAPGAGSLPTGAPLIFLPPAVAGTYRGVDVRYHRAGENIETAAVDPKSGRIYVAWEDNRFRTDEVNDIVITHSDDGGRTWTPVRRVNPGKTDDYTEHFTPAIEVGRDGILRVMYRQHKQTKDPLEIPDRTPFVDTYYQQSSDGVRFTKPLRINKVRTDIRFASFSRESAFLGDYNQIAVAGSWAYIVRCEAYRMSKRDKAEWPPAVHHQRAWVAVVDADGNGRV